jgi:hypothetical protein
VLPKQIDQFTATDERGGVHAVRVLELFHFVGGNRADESGHWAKSGRWRFIVDDEFEIEQDPHDSSRIALPGIGLLTRS